MKWVLLIFVIGIVLITIVGIDQDIIKDIQPGIDERLDFSTCIVTTGTIEEGIFGMHLHGNFLKEEKTYELIDDIGLAWVYFSFYWPTIEPEQDEDFIASYDYAIQELAKRNISIVASLGNYWPEWIDDSDVLTGEMAEMVKKVVHRYKPGGDFSKEYGMDYGIGYWEIINEPNYPCCGWGVQGTEQPVNPSLYAELLYVAHQAIRDEDPEAVILLGGLSSGHYDPLAFLEEIYSYGAKDCFDVVAYHPYGEVGRFNQSVQGLSEVMQKHRDSKPIWFNEIGDPSLAEQPRIFYDSVNQTQYISALFWLGFHDFGNDETWGIVDNDLTPREPMYSNVKEYIVGLK
ncbi:hypothetical protein H6504_05340 [Candidatus Woesearchaeota archaeon]|nr:hypothetical protein [Candidatus Woesearchaeota archaeon]